MTKVCSCLSPSFLSYILGFGVFFIFICPQSKIQMYWKNFRQPNFSIFFKFSMFYSLKSKKIVKKI